MTAREFFAPSFLRSRWRATIPLRFARTKHHRFGTTAHSPDGVIMGLSHPEFPLHGVQFHPESFLTENGFVLIENFLNLGPLEQRPGREKDCFMNEMTMMPGNITGVREMPITLEEDFLVFAGRFTHRAGTVLLMSGGDLDCARHHILAINPWMTIRGRGRQLWVQTDDGEALIPGNPFDALQNILDHFRLAQPFPTTPLAAGLLGYLAYDLKDAIEDLPRSSIDDLCLPHLYLTAPSLLVVQDKSTRKTRLFIPERRGNQRSQSEAGLAWFYETISGPPPMGGAFRGNVDGFTSNFSRPAYMDAIERIRSYITSGDVYQVNMSQRFGMDFSGDPFALFQRLYQINPAPFFRFYQRRRPSHCLYISRAVYSAGRPCRGDPSHQRHPAAWKNAGRG